VGNPSAWLAVDPLPAEHGPPDRPQLVPPCYRSAMVAISEEFRWRWETERVRREEAGLIGRARWMMMPLGDQPSIPWASRRGPLGINPSSLGPARLRARRQGFAVRLPGFAAPEEVT
jgi:hypothetical protein